MLFIQKINILIYWYYFLIVLFILSKYNSIDFQLIHDELARKVKLITNSSNYLVCPIAFIYIIFNICTFRFDKYINI